MNRWIIGLASLLTLCKVAVVQAQSPRLVVMITVEELRSDLLEELQDEMGEDGLRLLLQKGRQYTEVQHPLIYSNPTASEAIIHTGTTAQENNIAERNPDKRDRATGRRVPTNSVFEDKNFLGYATTGNYSPYALSCPTLSDGLKKATEGRALVFSIAPNAEEAIIGAGVYGDGAYWIDTYTGRWASSTYYKGDFPWYINKKNSGADALTERLSKGIKWAPESKPTALLALQKESPFSHIFQRTSSGISDFKESPLVNEEIVLLAKQVIESSGIGQDDVPDFLSLHLTLGNGNRTASDISNETIDSYLRLDRTIARLLSYLDLKNTLVVLTGNAIAKDYAPSAVDDKRIFRGDRCQALINMYLHAEYGVQGLIEEVTPDGAIYLNRDLISADAQLSQKEIESAVARFMTEVSGVSYAIESHKLVSGAIANSHNRDWQTALNRHARGNSPDVVFDILPSWVAQDLSNVRGVVSYRMVATPTVCVLYHPSIPSERITTPLDLRDISKKIAWALRIRPPTP